MKRLGFSATVLFILSTTVAPVWAHDADDGLETAELHLEPRLNALVGASEIGVEGRSVPLGLSGGLTFDLGAGVSKLETGALILRTGIGREGSLGLPMFAKIRLIDSDRQAWFFKIGGTSVFQSAGFDVLVGAGVGGRLPLRGALDLVLDATFNHGLLDASPGLKGNNQVEGVLLFTGLSFRI